VRRVAITGLGAISALGTGVAALWDGLLAARSGVRRISLFDPSSFLIQIAAEVPAFDPAADVTARQPELLDRFARFALVAAREAVGAARLDVTDPDRVGVAVGSGMGGATTQDAAYERLYRRGLPRAHPFSIVRIMNNAAASQLGIEFGFRGPTLSVATACAAATHAIGEAAEIIRSGRADVMLAGGAEAPITPGVLRSWEAMRVMAPAPPGDPSRACRPFSRDRTGMVLGEGAGIVVLEAWERALARGVPILAELGGYGATADASDVTRPAVEPASRAITTALGQARLNATDVDYVNAHGTGTRLNDPTETAIIKRAFGSAAARLAISSTKAVHGHAIGASGALELIAAVLAVRNGVVPPTANYTEPDPECDLDYVPNQPREMRVRAALSTSLAFGGLNAALVVRAVA
jgi:nodulation protein E